MAPHLRIEEINELSHEEQLRELARDLRSPRRRLNLREYFQLLEWGNLYTCLPPDGSWTTGVGYEIRGVHYGLLFTREDAAAAASGPGYVPKRVRVREMLERLADGWGVIVDYGTDAEVRISPDELTQENERIRIKRVRQEATDSWLAETNDVLKRQGVPREQRAAATMTTWASLNGFRVLPGSKRARRIEWYFEVVADATPTEARERCETLWRNAYAADPYLRHLDPEDLQRRLAAIRTNSLFTDRKTLPQELDEREWRELHEHVRYEHERRGLAFTEAIPVAERLAAWPRLDMARKAFDRYGGPKGQLFKFGDSKYLEPMLCDGSVRIFPAARYDDPSLLPAQRDNELARTVMLDASRMQITHTGVDGITRPIQAIGKAEVTARAGNNFYVWCVTTTFDPRLFDDFGGDTCLIIHDPATFLARMYAAMTEALPDWPGCSILVHYYDPVRPGDAVLSPLDKDFRYAYQREFRFLWDPPFPQRATTLLAPVDLCLGSLEDIATIIKL